MVDLKKGDIIKVDFNPTLGSKQSGYRRALIISNEDFYSKTGMLIILPITSTNNSFPLHVQLEKNVKTQGYVLCEHVKSIDANVRKIKYVESTSKSFIDKINQYIKAIL
jgi:mRNA interferase MazF